MIINRILLENYRGIRHREVEFAASGVSLLEGPNEAGKSSVFEAFALLLNDSYKHNSNAKPVAETRPVDADAATVIEAEFQVGPWQVVYRKQFHRNTGTQLQVLAPRPAQYAGGEAHSKMAEILSEHLDLTLFNALQVLQGAAAGQVALSDSAALSAALDSTGGSAADLESSETLLTRAQQHYLRYWTPSGQKTKEHRELLAQVQLAKEEVDSATKSLAEVTELARAHQSNQAQVAAYSAALAEADQELQQITGKVDAARKRQEAIERLQQRVRELEQLVANSKQVHAGRTEAVKALGLAKERLPELAQRHQELLREAREAASQAAAAKTALEKADHSLEQLQDQEQQRARAAQLTSQHRQWQQLQEQTARISEVQQELDEASARLAQTPKITKQQVARAEELWQQVTELTALQRAAAGSVQVQPLTGDLELLVNQEPQTFSELETLALTGPLNLTLPGQLSLTYSPAVGQSGGADLAQVQDDLAQLLSELGCADVPACRAALQQYDQALARQESAAKQVAALASPAQIAQQQAELAQLTELFADPANLSLATSAPEALFDDEALHSARAAVREARTDHDTLTDLAASARAKVEAAEAAHNNGIQVVAEREDSLTAQRAEISDEALSNSVSAAQVQLDEVARELDLLQANSEDDDVLERFTYLSTTVETLTKQVEDARDKASQSGAQLDVRAADGRHDDLQQAAADLDRITRQAQGYEARANSARYLYELLSRHRAATKQNYVAPLRRRIEQLGRSIFGSSFEVELDDSLVITHRTLAGTTLTVDQLSTGAQEQLGVLLRLASAALVDPEGAVPLVLDDALGASDSHRLQQLAGVINEVAATQQVIILTSAPQRYAALTNVKHITFT